MSILTDFKGSKGAVTNLRAGNANRGQFFVVAEDSSIRGTDLIRTPVPVSPLTGTDNVPRNTALTATAFDSAFNETRDFRRFEVRAAGAMDWLTLIYFEEIAADASTGIDPLLAENEAFEWRCRDVTVSGKFSEWSETQSFTTGAAFVSTPTIWVEGAPDSVPEAPTIQTTAFETVGAMDTHVSTDWEVRLNSDDSLIWSSYVDTVNLTEIQVPAGILIENETYKFRARHVGNTLGASAYGQALGTTVEEFFFTNTLVLDPQNFYGQNGEIFDKFTPDFDGIDPTPYSKVAYSNNLDYVALCKQYVAQITQDPIVVFRRTEAASYEQLTLDELPVQLGANSTIYTFHLSPDGKFLYLTYSVSSFFYFALYELNGNVYENQTGEPDSFVKSSGDFNSQYGVVLAVSEIPEYSSDVQYIAFASSGGSTGASSGVGSKAFILKKDGNGKFTIQLNVDVEPTAGGRFSFSTDTQYLFGALRSSENFAENLVVYRRTGDLFTKLAIEVPPGEQTLQYPNLLRGAISDDGTYIAAASRVWKRNGNVYEFLPNAIDIPGSGFSMTFSKDSEFLLDSVFNGSNTPQSPFVFTYKRVGDTFVKLAGLSPTASGSETLSAGFDPALTV